MGDISLTSAQINDWTWSTSRGSTRSTESGGDKGCQVQSAAGSAVAPLEVISESGDEFARNSNDLKGMGVVAGGISAGGPLEAMMEELEGLRCIEYEGDEEEEASPQREVMLPSQLSLKFLYYYQFLSTSLVKQAAEGSRRYSMVHMLRPAGMTLVSP